MRRRPFCSLAAFVALAAWLALGATPTLACSPPLDDSIAAQGPGQVVLLGTTGDPVPGGRAFHVEHYWNASGVATITIAFQEGEPIGDCSYPMEAGRRLIIAPSLGEDGLLHANIVTPQADPMSPEGAVLLAEANRLFGPGIAPVADGPVAADPGPDWSVVGLVGLVIVAVVVYVLSRRFLDRRRSAEELVEQAVLRAERDRAKTEAIRHGDQSNLL